MHVINSYQSVLNKIIYKKRPLTRKVELGMLGNDVTHASRTYVIDTSRIFGYSLPRLAPKRRRIIRDFPASSFPSFRQRTTSPILFLLTFLTHLSLS